MPESTPTYPFVDLRSRLRPERLERRARKSDQSRSSRRVRPIFEEAARWLCRAQDATGNGGLPGCYHLHSGWAAEAAETTGAAMSTMLSLAEIFPELTPLKRAIRLGKSINTNCETVNPGVAHAVVSEDIVGGAWAILGWLALYEKTGKSVFKLAASRIGNLVVQWHEDGILEKMSAMPHQAVLTWALQRLFRADPIESFNTIADTMGNSIVGHCAPDGYLYGGVGANGMDPALIHLAQTLYSLLEAGILARKRTLIIAAQIGARQLYDFYRQRGTLAGRYGPDWRPDHSFNCMAGCAQTALLWLRLYQHGISEDYYPAAAQLARFITSTIDTTNPDPGIRGGIRAGYPLWVDYHPLTYSTMAARLALDVFLLVKELAPEQKPVRRLLFKRPAEPGRPGGGS